MVEGKSRGKRDEKEKERGEDVGRGRKYCKIAGQLKKR